MSKSAPHLVSGTALGAAVALMLVTAVLDPLVEGGPAEAGGISRAGGQITLAGLATIALAVLLAVGVAALLPVVHGDGRRLLAASAVLAALGAPGFVLDAAVELIVLDLASSNLGAGALSNAAGLLEGGLAETLACGGILLVWAALLLFPVAVWRAGLAPAPLAALLLVATLVEPPSHQLRRTHIAVHLVLLAGYVALAHRLWSAGSTPKAVNPALPGSAERRTSG